MRPVCDPGDGACGYQKRGGKKYPPGRRQGLNFFKLLFFCVLFYSYVGIKSHLGGIIADQKPADQVNDSKVAALMKKEMWMSVTANSITQSGQKGD